MCLTIANEKCIVCVGQFSDCGGCIHHSILFNIQTFTANPFYRSFQKPVPQANSQTSSCYGFLQFRLNVPDLQDIAEESRRVLGDVPHKALAATPFCVELSLRTPEGESMVLEIWELCKYLIWVENYCGNHTYTVVFKLWNSKYIYLYLYIFLLQMLLLSSFLWVLATWSITTGGRVTEVGIWQLQSNGYFIEKSSDHHSCRSRIPTCTEPDSGYLHPALSTIPWRYACECRQYEFTHGWFVYGHSSKFEIRLYIWGKLRVNEYKFF